MNRTAQAAGLAELLTVAKGSFWLVVQAALFSTFVNLLMLTGPLYMLQVYDRVIASRSEHTLVALSLLVAFLYLLMVLLDVARAQVMARVGTALHEGLGRRVFSAALARMVTHAGDPAAEAAQNDLDALRLTLGAPVLMALFDMPWTPVFLAALFVFHPLLGWAALSGGAILIALALLNQITTRQPRAEAAQAVGRAARLAGALKAEAEIVHGLGMRSAGFARWQAAQAEARDAGLHLADRHGGYAAATRGFRLFLQSAMLGLGAWLVLRNELSAGAMIAGSVLMGRALAPVELALAQWSTLQRAVDAMHRLARLLSDTPATPEPLALPAPHARLAVEHLTVVPPGGQQATLRMVSFRLEPGQAMAVIGASGAGKSTLARALAGIWPASAGTIRLDTAPLDSYPPDMLGRHLGYLPQRVTLFDGTIAENIARLDTAPDPAAVIAAARHASVHELILRLPQGYDTHVTALGAQLSGGQLQRIGLARALYGDPAILILDEPGASLDNRGAEALGTAIRQAKADGRAVIVMAHRPSSIRECDLVLVLDGGTRRAFGPRDTVLREMVQNHGELGARSARGGVA